MDFGDSVQKMMDSIMDTLPKVVVFLVVLVVGWIIARMLRRVCAMVLGRVGFERMAERGMLGDALSRSEYTATAMLASLVYYTVLLITLQMAFGVFGRNPVSDLLNSLVAWLPRLFVAVVLVVVASAIASVVKTMVATALSATSYGRAVATMVSVFIIAIGVIAALNQVGIATTVTTPIMIAVLATVGAILAIGVGGGLVRPMQERWERILTAAESETTRAREAAAQRGREDALRGGGVPAEAETEQAERPEGAPH